MARRCILRKDYVARIYLNQKGTEATRPFLFPLHYVYVLYDSDVVDISEVDD